jgi:hypothetical protein
VTTPAGVLKRNRAEEKAAVTLIKAVVKATHRAGELLFEK